MNQGPNNPSVRIEDQLNEGRPLFRDDVPAPQAAIMKGSLVPIETVAVGGEVHQRAIDANGQEVFVVPKRSKGFFGSRPIAGEGDKIVKGGFSFGNARFVVDSDAPLDEHERRVIGAGIAAMGHAIAGRSPAGRITSQQQNEDQPIKDKEPKLRKPFLASYDREDPLRAPKIAGKVAAGLAGIWFLSSSVFVGIHTGKEVFLEVVPGAGWVGDKLTGGGEDPYAFKIGLDPFKPHVMRNTKLFVTAPAQIIDFYLGDGVSK